MTLAELLDELSTDAGVTPERAGDGTTTWSGTGGPFARLDAAGRVIEFHLDATVAAAAWRTPDASTSDAGPDWVAFSPRELDEHAIDRATAWFAAAARRSG
jgi:2,4-dienoyl-CoA reductase-like NADH-dependent reductase (Old Yellow Enzyme family)